VGVIPLESLLSILEDESGQGRWMILILLIPAFLGALVLVAMTYEFRNWGKK